MLFRSIGRRAAFDVGTPPSRWLLIDLVVVSLCLTARKVLRALLRPLYGLWATVDSFEVADVSTAAVLPAFGGCSEIDVALDCGSACSDVVASVVVVVVLGKIPRW